MECPKCNGLMWRDDAGLVSSMYCVMCGWREYEFQIIKPIKVVTRLITLKEPIECALCQKPMWTVRSIFQKYCDDCRLEADELDRKRRREYMKTYVPVHKRKETAHEVDQ